MNQTISMHFTLYGLSNCDVTKKAIHWFKENKIDFIFHNTRAEPISKEKIQSWCTQVGWEKLLNKKGTTFRKLHPAVKMNATTEAAAVEIMTIRQSTIKRPIIEKNNKIITLGFDEKKYEIVYL